MEFSAVATENCIKTEFLCDPEFFSLHQVCWMTESFVVRYIPSSPNFPDSEWFWQIFLSLNQPELVYGFVSLEAKNLVTTYFSVLPPSLCQLSLQARIPLTSCNCGQKWRQTRWPPQGEGVTYIYVSLLGTEAALPPSLLAVFSLTPHLVLVRNTSQITLSATNKVFLKSK